MAVSRTAERSCRRRNPPWPDLSGLPRSRSRSFASRHLRIPPSNLSAQHSTSTLSRERERTQTSSYLLLTKYTLGSLLHSQDVNPIIASAVRCLGTPKSTSPLNILGDSTSLNHVIQTSTLQLQPLSWLPQLILSRE